MTAKKFPIESSHVMMFARSIGDSNQIYYDEDYAKASDLGQMIAPPTFIQASAHFDPDWPMRPKIGEQWLGSAKEVTGLSKESDLNREGGRLHAEQHFEYHQQIAVGDVLSGESRPGKTWEKEGQRGGKLRFEEIVTDFRNQDDQLIVTATNVVVYLERIATSADE